MPPRLSHRKSSKGCFTCKKRKVKCDEGKPRCGACARHGVECNYPENEFRAFEPPDSIASTADGHNSGIGISDASFRWIAEDPSKLQGPDSQLQLRLLHYFTATTSQSFSSAGKLWRRHVPHLAFDDPALFHAMLGVTALHLARDQEECEVYLPDTSAESVAQISRVCFGRALSGHRTALSDLGPHNVEPTYFAAILISLHSLVLMGSTREAEGQAGEAFWFTLGAGIRQIATVWCKKENQNIFGPAGPFREEADLTDEADLFDWTHAEPFERLHDSMLELHSMAESDRQALRDTISCVGLIYTRIITKGESPTESCRRIIALPARLPPAFTAAVIESRPWALVIVAHIFALMRLLEDDIFWFRKIADQQFPALSSRIPLDSHSLLEWPVQLLRRR